MQWELPHPYSTACECLSSKLLNLNNTMQIIRTLRWWTFSLLACFSFTGHAIDTIDNFSTPVLDCSKFDYGTNSNTDIYANSSRLHLTLEPYSSAPGKCRARVLFEQIIAREAANAISTNVRLTSAILKGEMNYTAFELSGYFYNTRSDEERAAFASSPAATGNTAQGEVGAYIRFGNRGSGLEVWYEIWESLDKSEHNTAIRAQGVVVAPGTLTLGVDYPISIVY